MGTWTYLELIQFGFGFEIVKWNFGVDGMKHFYVYNNRNGMKCNEE